MKLEVGLGKACITPPLGTLCAQGLGAECEAILDDVFVRAVVLRSGERTVCLLSADVLGIDRKDIEEMRAAVTAATGIPADHISCHTTHSHESPGARTQSTHALLPYGLTFHSPDFYRQLLDGAARAAEQGLASARPCLLRCGKAVVEDIASNRRCGVFRDDDRTLPWMRSSRALPEHRALPIGDIDPLVRVLVFADPTGSPFGLLVSYACHVTVAGGDEAPYITSDFPGEAIRCLEAEDGLAAIHFTGAAGDINPGKFTGSGNAIEERVADVKLLGGRYLQAVRQALASAAPLPAGRLLWGTRPLFLPVREDLPTRLQLAAAVEKGVVAYLAAPEGSPERAHLGTSMCRDLLYSGAASQIVGQHFATEVAALRIGDFGSVFLPGECFLSIDRQIRSSVGLHNLVIIAYSDLGMSYVCSRQACEEGGYGPQASLLSADAADLLVDQATDLFASLGP